MLLVSAQLNKAPVEISNVGSRIWIAINDHKILDVKPTWTRQHFSSIGMLYWKISAIPKEPEHIMDFGSLEPPDPEPLNRLPVYQVSHEDADLEGA